MKTKNFPGKKQLRRNIALGRMRGDLNKLRQRLSSVENKDRKAVVQLRMETLELVIHNTEDNSVDNPRERRTKKVRTK